MRELIILLVSILACLRVYALRIISTVGVFGILVAFVGYFILSSALWMLLNKK